MQRKIKFFTGSQIIADGYFYLIPTQWFLKNFYDHHGASPESLTWLDTVYDLDWTIDSMLSVIEQEQPDIIACGMYIWNFGQKMQLMSAVKQRFPHIIILAGGPSLDAHRDSEFFEKYPFIDYVSYGDGEIGFKNLLDKALVTPGKKVNNLIYCHEGRVIKGELDIFRYNKAMLPSPYLYNRDSVIKAANYINTKFPELTVAFNWEHVRGCPYKCSFCDWSSGLHHKVTKRVVDWREEISFLADMGKLRFIDANVGMFPEDEEIITWCLEKYGANMPLFNFNVAKLHKERVFRIWSKVLAHIPNYEFQISQQDFDPDVLDAIDRPDIPWDEHRAYLMDLYTQYPHIEFRVDLIGGLPRQTLDSMINNIKICEDIGARIIRVQPWHLLPNSPASDENYRKKYNLKVLDAIHSNEVIMEYIGADTLAKNIEKWYSFRLVVQDYPDSVEDLYIMVAMIAVYNYVQDNRKTIKIKFIKLLDKIMDNIRIEVKNVIQDNLSFCPDRPFIGAKIDDQIIPLEIYFRKKPIIMKLLGK